MTEIRAVRSDADGEGGFGPRDRPRTGRRRRPDCQWGRVRCEARRGESGPHRFAPGRRNRCGSRRVRRRYAMRRGGRRDRSSRRRRRWARGPGAGRVRRRRTPACRAGRCPRWDRPRQDRPSALVSRRVVSSWIVSGVHYGQFRAALDQAGVEPAGDHVGVGEQRAQEADVGGDSEDPVSARAARSRRRARGAVRAVGDDLGQHRVVGAADVDARGQAGVDPEPSPRGLVAAASTRPPVGRKPRAGSSA